MNKQYKEDEQKLKNLLYSEDLSSIETISNKFNIFKTLKLTNQELKHSRFLSWLLNPNETHKLGTYPLKEFLKTISDYVECPFNIFDIDDWDISDTDIYTERDKIDLLIVNSTNKFVCLIENKIWTKNHSKQLSRYKQKTEKNYPDYKKVFVYLTPNGDEPKEDEAAKDYICISYKQHIYYLIKKIIDYFHNDIDNDILLFITHYKIMLEEDIMVNKTIEELCKKIYKNHQKALDLIFEYKPDLQKLISNELQKIISNDDDYKLDTSTKTFIRFYPKKFEKYNFLKKGKDWTETKNILLFEFSNRESTKLTCSLIIGPSENNKIREKIYEIAKRNCYIKKALTEKWTAMDNKIFKFTVKISSVEEEEEKNINSILSKQFTDNKSKLAEMVDKLCHEFDKLNDSDF